MYSIYILDICCIGHIGYILCLLRTSISISISVIFLFFSFSFYFNLLIIIRKN